MFQSSTILRELVQSLAKVTLLLKHSVKLRSCKLCGDVAARREMTCVLFVVHTLSAQQTAHTTNRRELVQSLAEVTLLLKHSVKLGRCILCGDVAACREIACVLFGVQTAACTTNSTHAISRHAATSPHNIQRRNFTECFNRSVTLSSLCTSSLRMVEDQNM
jgi:hypothetical protein